MLKSCCHTILESSPHIIFWPGSHNDAASGHHLVLYPATPSRCKGRWQCNGDNNANLPFHIYLFLLVAMQKNVDAKFQNPHLMLIIYFLYIFGLVATICTLWQWKKLPPHNLESSSHIIFCPGSHDNAACGNHLALVAVQWGNDASLPFHIDYFLCLACGNAKKLPHIIPESTPHINFWAVF